MVSPARSQSNPTSRTRPKAPAKAISKARRAEPRRPQAVVVDPDTTAAAQLARHLGALGWEVHTVRDPARASSVIARRDPHVVFLDVSDADEHLDSKSLDAMRLIRAGHEQLDMVCMSTRPDVQVAVEVIRHRALDYVTKPLAANRVDTVSQAVLERCGLAEDVEEQIHREVGRRVRQHRKTLGYTLQQVADLTGLSVSLISQIELGKSGASLLSLHRLGRALDAPMAAFLGDC